MSIRLQFRRGTTAQHSTFTGADGEVTVDSTKKTLVVHDGATAGGYPLTRQGSAGDFTTVSANSGTTATAGSFNSSNNTYGLDVQYKYNGTLIGSVGSSKGIDSTGALTGFGIHGVNSVDIHVNYSRKGFFDASGAFVLGKTAIDDTTAGFAWRASGYVSIVRNGSTGWFNRITTTGDVVQIAYNGAQVGSISTNGTVTSYNTSSDYRLKVIEGAITPEMSGAFIDALMPKYGTWKKDGSYFAGFLAHEFQAVSPSSVTGEKDAVGEDGEPIYQAMQASSPEVMANLIAEAQFLRQRTKTLESTLSEVLARLESLEAGRA